LSSDSQVTRWRDWVHREMSQERLNDFSEHMEQALKEFNPDASSDKIREFTIATIMAESLANGAHKMALAAVDRDQTERHGRTKAQLEERKVRVAEQRIAQQSCELFLKWYHDQKARDIADSGLSNAEKIAALRKTYFADVDELERTGRVQIPE
jgi:hypothetical protein